MILYSLSKHTCSTYKQRPTYDNQSEIKKWYYYDNDWVGVVHKRCWQFRESQKVVKNWQRIRLKPGQHGEGFQKHVKNCWLLLWMVQCTLLFLAQMLPKVGLVGSIKRCILNDMAFKGRALFPFSISWHNGRPFWKWNVILYSR